MAHIDKLPQVSPAPLARLSAVKALQIQWKKTGAAPRRGMRQPEYEYLDQQDSSVLLGDGTLNSILVVVLLPVGSTSGGSDSNLWGFVGGAVGATLAPT